MEPDGYLWTDKESQRCGTSRIVENKDYGYYRFTFAHQMPEMKKEVTEAASLQGRSGGSKTGSGGAVRFSTG